MEGKADISPASLHLTRKVRSHVAPVLEGLSRAAGLLRMVGWMVGSRCGRSDASFSSGLVIGQKID